MVTAVAWELHHSADWLNLVSAVITRLWLKTGMEMFIFLNKYAPMNNVIGPSTN